MNPTKIAAVIEEILADELAPKRLKTVASKIARAVVKEAKLEVALSPPKVVAAEVSPQEALKIIAKAIGGKAPAPRRAMTKPDAPKAKAAAAAKKAPAKKTAPAKKAASSKKAPATKKAPAKAKGKRKLSADASKVMGAKKELYWALFRKAKGDKPKEHDAQTIKDWMAQDKKLVNEYNAKIKAKLDKTPAAKPAAKPKSAAKPKANKPAAKPKAAAKPKSEPKATAKPAPAPEPEPAPEAAPPPKPGTNGAASGGMTDAQREALGL